jgi:hypothetical protein
LRTSRNYVTGANAVTAASASQRTNTLPPKVSTALPGPQDPDPDHRFPLHPAGEPESRPDYLPCLKVAIPWTVQAALKLPDLGLCKIVVNVRVAIR